MNIECDGCGRRLGELRGGTLDNRVVTELTKVVDAPVPGGAVTGDFRVAHLCRVCTAAVLNLLTERRNHIPHPDCDRFEPQAQPATTPEPGPCASPGCVVLHDDPANPVHHPDGKDTEGKVGGNFGHGWVWARPNGVKVRCGGPALCQQCSRDQAAVGGRALNPVAAAMGKQAES